MTYRMMNRQNRIAAALAVAVAAVLVTASGVQVAAQEQADELYLQAREELIEDNYTGALALFERVVRDHARSERADDAQYYIGYTLERMGRTAEAITAYERLLDRWPDSSRADSARDHLLDLAADRAERGEGTDLSALLDSRTSWEFRRDVAMTMARQGDISAVAVLEDIMRRESSSRQGELIRVLGSHLDDPLARRIIGLGCESARSSSIQLLALRTLRPVAPEADVLSAIGEAIARNNSSSVQIEAIQVLAPHIGRPEVQRVMMAALVSGNSSSVQIAALRALRGHLLDPEVQPGVVALFTRSESSSVQLEALRALEGDLDRVEAAEVLEAAAAARNTSSVQQEALRMAARSRVAAVRNAARVGLARGNSSSVQIEAVRAYRELRDDEDAAAALEDLLQSGGISSSVQLEAVRALLNHTSTQAAPRAAAAALDNRNSSSVQLEALEVAELMLPAEPILRALRQLLATSGTSSSVQLKAITVLSGHIDQDLATELIGSALHRTNSSSVKLAAIDALEPARSRTAVRTIILGGLERGHSSSVGLAAVTALEDYVDSDDTVHGTFIDVMRDRNMSSSVRVRTAEALLPGADQALERQIVQAMEDVIERRWRDLRRNRFRYNDDTIADALDIVRAINPDHARELERLFGPPPTLLERIFGSPNRANRPPGF